MTQVQLSPSRTRRVFLWLVFVALVAGISLCVSIEIHEMKGETVRTTALLAEGDGFLIAIAISADALGRALEKQKKTKATFYFSIASGIVLIYALFNFGIVKVRLLDRQTRVDQSVLALDQSLAHGQSPAIEMYRDLYRAYKEPQPDEAFVTRSSEIAIGLSLVLAFVIVVE